MLLLFFSTMGSMDRWRNKCRKCNSCLLDGTPRCVLYAKKERERERIASLNFWKYHYLEMLNFLQAFFQLWFPSPFECCTVHGHNPKQQYRCGCVTSHSSRALVQPKQRVVKCSRKHFLRLEEIFAKAFSSGKHAWRKKRTKMSMLLKTQNETSDALSMFLFELISSE